MVENPRSRVAPLCSGRGINIKTAMTCSQTGGLVVGAEGMINVGMVSGGLAGGGGGGGGVEASEQLESQRSCQGTPGHERVWTWCGVVARVRGQEVEKVP